MGYNFFQNAGLITRSMKEIKVCMITVAYYPEYSGAATQCHTLSKKLIKKDCKIIVVTFTNNKQLPTRECIDGIEVHRIHVSKKGFTGFVTALKLLFCLVKEFSKFKIIHFHGFNNHLLWVVWFGSIFRKKMIMKISMMGVDTPEVMMNNGLFSRIAYQHLDRIIATTSTMMKEFQDFPSLNTKGVLIPNGVDTYLFHPVDENERTKLRSELGLPISKKIILFSGVIGKRKGLDILLSAWEMLRKNLTREYPHLCLLGPFEADIRDFSKENYHIQRLTQQYMRQFPKDITCFRMVRNVEDYLKASDIFVLPTLNEGMPNSLLEAIACGLFCVVNNFPGLEDVITHDSKLGIILNSHNEEDLYHTLQKALVVVGERVRCEEKVLLKYSINTISEQYYELYSEVMR